MFFFLLVSLWVTQWASTSWCLTYKIGGVTPRHHGLVSVVIVSMLTLFSWTLVSLKWLLSSMNSSIVGGETPEQRQILCPLVICVVISRYSGAVNYLSLSHWQRQTEGPLWIAMATPHSGVTLEVLQWSRMHRHDSLAVSIDKHLCISTKVSIKWHQCQQTSGEIKGRGTKC